MRAGFHRWMPCLEFSGVCAQRLEHAAHQHATLSHLLRDPCKAPLVIVAGQTYSACTALYHVLPTAVCSAYLREAALSGGAADGCVDYSNRLHSSSVRLVPHTSALLGPERCIATGAYVDIFGAAAEPVSVADAESPLGSQCEGGPSLRDAGYIVDGSEDCEQSRQRVSSAFNEQFLSLIRDGQRRFPLSYKSLRETAPTSLSEKLHASLSLDRHSQNQRCCSCGLGSLVSHDDTHRESLPRRIHWVVTRWVMDSNVDPQHMIEAWRGVLNGSRPGEVVSLVLFVNVEVVDMAPLIGDSASQKLQLARGLEKGMIESEATRCVSPPPYGCAACAAVWLRLSSSSRLASAFPSFRRQATAAALPSSFCAPLAEMTGTALPAPRSCVQAEVPVVRCWDTTSPAAKRAHSKYLFSSTLDVFRRLASVGGSKQSDHSHPLLPALDHLHRIPEPLHRWEWVLGTESSHLRAPRSDAMLSCALPYLIVGDAEDRHRENQKAVRRNAIDAATLHHLRSRVRIADNSRTGDITPNRCFPNPRYFTTLVSDAGSLLARDGCLSDLFVIQFQPALLEVKLTRQCRSSVRTETLLAATTAEQRWYHAYQRHLSDATKFLEMAIPSASVTREFVKSGIQFLQSCGCGHGVLAWPLTSPTEGHRCLRVAFTMTHEFYVNPLLAVGRYGRVEGAGRVGNAQTSRPGPEDDLASCAAAVSAGSGCYPPRLATAEMKDVIVYILKNMRKLGWVLVWQEDHHRWPTAVPPPHMHPINNPSPSFFSPRRHGSRGLHERIAVSLEQWRQEKRCVDGKRYNAEAPLKQLEGVSSDSAVGSSTFSSALDVVAPSPYTSLELWQAALIGQEEGMYLWEGQTVFLADGRPGVIIDFRSPPAELFMPVEHHTTEAKRTYWRLQQQLHADFIRFYRWRRHCCAATHPRRLAAAFTGLPCYLRKREMTHFPVVELLQPTTAGNKKVVHVLPRRTVQHRVPYPRVCLVSVAEQKRWHEAQGRLIVGDDNLRNEVWQLPTTDTDGRSTSHVTLLRLPLSPFRIEVAASIFVSHVMKFSRSSADSEVQCDLWQSGSTGIRGDLLERLKREWAVLHRNSPTGDTWTAPLLKSLQSSRHTHWRSFAARPSFSFLPFSP